EQRVEGVAAIAAWTRLVSGLGAPAPGPAPAGMRTFPDGRAWLAVPSWTWRQVGVDAKRAETVRAAAAVDASLGRLVGRPLADVDRALRSIRGVGAWTSAEVRQRAFGDADAVSVGDFHLAAIVGQTLAGRPFTDQELLPFLAPWRPHRYRVARLIYATGVERLPRRAPRAPRRRGAEQRTDDPWTRAVPGP
ncbi:DNA-3-methyladenine glycosylase family protein, partial [uncultured Amnibacterium sp.]|uniref:DNA-3-methyladenine glycosylase family protein n=1 Tax=uncultured Amnibacterium sp. TaxID=1631851 RepID=UPI0035CC026B